MRERKAVNRIWELDFARGIALILMVYFHVVFDMKDIFSYNVSYSTGINFFAGRTSALLFMFISGISCSLSRSNTKRGLKVLAIAMIITVATHLYDPNLGIKFGILHFLGTSMLLYPLFRNLKGYLLIILGIVIIALGQVTSRITMPYDYFFPLGLTSNSFVSSDYYSLIPWLGVFIFGIAAGKSFYKNKTSLFSFYMQPNAISLAGRHTLPVYLIHQPLILLVLTLVNSHNF